MTMTRLVAVAVFVGLVGGGCDCRSKPQQPGQYGEIGIVYEADGVIVTNPNGTYDFGKVPMGTSPKMKVTIRNLGLAKLDLVSVQKDSGDNLKLGDSLNESPPVFEMAFTPTTVDPGDTVEFDLTFDSPVEADMSIKTKDHQSTIILRGSGVEMGKETSQIVFKGTSVSGSCVLPTTIDFGAVAINDTVKQKFTITNNSPLQTTATIGAIMSNSGDDAAFGFAPESISGQSMIPAGASRDLVFTFKPTDVHDYLALVKARAADECPELTIHLVGSGVNQVLSCATACMSDMQCGTGNMCDPSLHYCKPGPNLLDFGYVTPLLTVQKEYVLVNQGLAPVSMTAVAAKVGTTLSADYKVLGADTFMVPGATRTGGTLSPGTATVELTFTPQLLGIRQGALTGNTSLGQQPMLSCPLRGQGGGPDIRVNPTMMNVGKIPFFATAPSPFFVTRKITVSNLGTNPTPDDPVAHLYLGKMGMGTPFEVMSKNGDSPLSDICVGTYDDANHNCTATLPSTYDPMVGIKAVAGSGFLDIPVRIQPHDKNLNMEYDIIIYSNDPDQPAVTVNVKAQSVELPPCNYSVTPTSLNFGLVTPPNYRDLSFQIKNLGVNANETCLITHLALKAGSDPIFTLPAGELDQVELQPGGVQNVTVRAWPMGTASATINQVMGDVEFGISSPMYPQKDVSLAASIATACLTITPSDLDFGTVKKGCNSPRRVFNIYNTCTTGITVVSYGMLAAAGVAGGTFGCMLPMGQTCPEFLIDGTPGFMAGSTIPAGASMPVTFALKYHPYDDGPDTGAFQLKVTQNGQNVDYIVTLRGAGDNFGLNTDTFRQDSKPKADILLVIDDSGSMSDKQQGIGNNFSSFIRYAVTAGVDFHIAVVPTEIGAARMGKFIGGPNNAQPVSSTSPNGYSGPKVVTSQMPNAEALFKDQVRDGTTGGYEGMSCEAVMALTAPYITDPTINAGFLRPDAVLAVVAVTDAEDQCPAAATVYENQLRNVKGAQHANLMSYNVIGPFSPQAPGGCSYDCGTGCSEDLSKHLYLINSFSGVKDEICTTNWSTTLENLGKTAFGYRTNFFLTAEPDLTGGNTIVIKIDHGDGAGPQTLDPTDSRGAPVWSYDSVSNSVVFQPLFVPAPGDVMTVTYHVACL
jgi:hypothetical protein